MTSKTRCYIYEISGMTNDISTATVKMMIVYHHSGAYTKILPGCHVLEFPSEAI